MKKLILILGLILIASICLAYTIGYEDVLQIKSVSAPEINGEYIVSPDGYISIPYAGRIFVYGKTEAQTTKDIENLLSDRIKYPEVYVNLTKTTNDVVFVTGFIKNAGSVIINNDTTLATIVAERGDLPVSDKTTIVGNVYITIKSLDGTKKELSYEEIMDVDYTPKNGDIINFEIRDKINVNVVGKVNIPGKYILSKDNDSIMSAIVLAGGFAPEADYSQVTLYNADGKGETVDLSDFINGISETALVKVTDNSTIVVPELIAGVTVLGWVNNQGKQTYRPDQTIYLADVIANAGGGVRNKARFKEVYVLRNVNGELTKTSYNFNDYKNKGDITGNPIIKNGDVVYMPCTLEIDWAVVISSIRGLVGLGKDVNNF